MTATLTTDPVEAEMRRRGLLPEEPTVDPVEAEMRRRRLLPEDPIGKEMQRRGLLPKPEQPVAPKAQPAQPDQPPSPFAERFQAQLDSGMPLVGMSPYDSPEERRAFRQWQDKQADEARDRTVPVAAPLVQPNYPSQPDPSLPMPSYPQDLDPRYHDIEVAKWTREERQVQQDLRSMEALWAGMSKEDQSYALRTQPSVPWPAAPGRAEWERMTPEQQAKAKAKSGDLLTSLMGPGDDKRPGLFKRGGQQFYNAMLGHFFENRRLDLGDAYMKVEQQLYQQKLAEIEKKFGHPWLRATNIETARIYATGPKADLIKAQLRQAKQIERFVTSGERPFENVIPPSEGVGEKVADVVGGLGAFMVKLWIARRITKGLPIPALKKAPRLQNMLAWELVNTYDEGEPGAGALMGGTLMVMNSLKAVSIAAKAGKLGGESAMFAGLAYAQGGDLEDIIIAALIPPALAGAGKMKQSLKARFGTVRTLAEYRGIVNEGIEWRQKALKELGFGPRDAPTKGQIKKAQHDLTLKTHPDLVGPKGAKRMVDVNVAARKLLHGVPEGQYSDKIDWARRAGIRKPIITPPAEPGAIVPTKAPRTGPQKAKTGATAAISPEKVSEPVKAGEKPGEGEIERPKPTPVAKPAAKAKPKKSPTEIKLSRERTKLQKDILDYHNREIGPIDAEAFGIANETVGEGEQYGVAFSTSFGGKFPGELTDHFPGGKIPIKYRKFLRENVSHGRGEETLSALGGDEFLRRVEIMAQGQKGDARRAIDSAEKFAKSTRDTEMLLRIKRYRDLASALEGETESLKTSTLKPGDTFEHGGEKYTVTNTGEGTVEIEDGISGEVPDDTTIQVDKGSVKKGKETAKPAPKTDLFGKPVSDKLTGEQGTLGLEPGKTTGKAAGEVKIKPALAAQVAKFAGEPLVTTPEDALLAMQHDFKGKAAKYYHNPDNPLPEVTEAWNRATKGGALFGEGQQSMAKGARIPVSMGPAGEAISAATIIADMRRDYGVPVRVGHFKKRAGGIYKRREHVVRLREANNIATGAHEIAHHIDNTYKITRRPGLYNQIPAKAKAELVKLDYEYPKKRRTSEGFAEYIRHRLTTEEAKTVAPEFDAWFEKEFLAGHPDVAAKFAQTRKQITRWREQGAEARVHAAISKTGKPATPEGMTKTQWLKERKGRAKLWLQSKITNDLVYLEHAERLMTGGTPLAKDMSPSALASVMSQAAPDMARSAIEDGVFSIVTGKRIAPGMREAFEKLGPMKKEEFADFISFVYARHAIGVWAKGKNPGISLADARYVVNKRKSTPNWKEAADTLVAFNKGLITVLEEVGRVSPEGAKAIREAYPAYVPLKRVYDSVKKGGLGRRGYVNVASPIKRLKGSGRQIIQPLQSMVLQAEQVYAAASKTLVARRLIELAEKKQGLGKWVERIPGPTQTQVIKLEQLRSQLQAAGYPVAVNDMNAMMYITTPGTLYRGGEPIAKIYREGKAEWYEFDPELYKAITSLDFYRLPAFLEMTLGKATRMVRLGATGLSPSFTLRNMTRDTGTFIMQTEHVKGPISAVLPVYETAKYAKGKIEKFFGDKGPGDPFVRMWQRYGGRMAQPLGLDRGSIQRSLKEVMANTTKQRTLNVAKHPVDFVREVLGVTEAGGRLAEFKAAMKKRGWTRERIEKGEQPPMSAIIEAMQAASDVTVNFKRAGSVGRAMNRAVPFFNANIQGIGKTARTFRAHPVRSMIRGIAYLALPTLWLWWRNKDEDWYKELPAWQKYGFWNFKVGDHIIRIPRPFEWGLLMAGLPEAGAEAAYRDDPEAITKEFKEHAVDMVVPDVVPALFKPAMEVAFNYDTFRERPIVSRRLQDRKPADQYNKYNTWLAKKIGEYTNTSPAKIDHLMSSYSGGLLTKVAKQTEAIVGVYEDYGFADIPMIGGLVTRGIPNKSVNQFYERLQEVTQERNSAADRGEVPADLKNSFSVLSRYSREMAEIRRTIRGSTDPKEVRRLQRKIVGMARQAIKKAPLKAYPAYGPEWIESRRKGLSNVVHRMVGEKTEPADYKRTIRRLQGYGLDREQTLKLLRDKYYKHSKPLKNTEGAKQRARAFGAAKARLKARWPISERAEK